MAKQQTNCRQEVMQNLAGNNGEHEAVTASYPRCCSPHNNQMMMTMRQADPWTEGIMPMLSKMMNDSCAG